MSLLLEYGGQYLFGATPRVFGVLPRNPPLQVGHVSWGYVDVVTVVVSLQDDADLACKGLVLSALENAYRTHGLGFHRIPVPDGDDRHLAARLGDIVALLNRLTDAGECVYLHCNAGLNRAPTAAIAYLHTREGLSLEAARDAVKRARHCVPYMRVLHDHFGGGR